MPEHAVVQRWRHPAFLIFLLGGFLGLFLNLGVSLLLVFRFSVNPLTAFAAGTLLNQLFHYFYYNVVYVNQEIRMRTSFPLHLLLSLLVSAGAAALLWFFLSRGWNLPQGLAACLFLLAASNAFLNRISTFSSAKM
ncbi:MAG TPA: hypothetical protein VMV05_10925, partial [bacterium]|nr:hypothetical protein [bacterium]